MSETICSTRQECGCQNLNDREVTKRKVLGYGCLVIAFALVGLSKVPDQPDWMAAMPAIPFFFGYLNLGQARSRTCVLLAFTEQDQSSDEKRPVSDRATSRRLKKRSAKLMLGSAAMALLTAALCWKV